jgi:SAM-dependent methyltransferase
MLPNARCPNCRTTHMTIFYEVSDVPVHSVLLLPTREAALTYPKGNIALGFCPACGFIANTAFDPDVHEYSSSYEETQGFSSTFNAFHRSLALRLIERYNLRDKTIIEIGCGKGEFLALLGELGNNHGIGFDPAYVSSRNQSAVQERLTFIKDFYSDKYAAYQADFVCCKMTLEHIQQTADFVSLVRHGIGDRSETVVFFQVPDVTRILQELAFWDIYYEHCSYFSLGSLARLFRQCDFAVLDLATDYDGQYLLIEARPRSSKDTPALPQEQDLDMLRRDVTHFAQHYPHKLETWQGTLQQMHQRGQRVVIWGGGSKGVAFLTTLKIYQEITYAVDINPYKHGTYMAGTGQEIVGPDFLCDYKPDVVIIMNPIYREEIRQTLAERGLTPDLLTV